MTYKVPINPYVNGRKLEHIKFVSVVFCGRCESEFLIKLKEGLNKPNYECPKCKVANTFDVIWK